VCKSENNFKKITSPPDIEKKINNWPTLETTFSSTRIGEDWVVLRCKLISSPITKNAIKIADLVFPWFFSYYKKCHKNGRFGFSMVLLLLQKMP
jgi:hypothetical protein